MKWCSIKFKKYDYEQLCNINLANVVIDKLRYLFYLLEKITFAEILDHFGKIYTIFSYYTNNDERIMNKLANILEKNKPIITNKLWFGKYGGHPLNSIPHSYLEYISDCDVNCECDSIKHKQCK